MSFGYNGKILRVNLTTGQIQTEEPGLDIYRMYWGGSCLGTYYLMKEVPPGIDALSPENKLILTASVLTGAPISGLSRMNIVAKSPLTGTAGDTQSGGTWPAEFKRSGFDGIIIEGSSEQPVYLWIQDGQAEIRDARHLWGKVSGEVEDTIHSELDDNQIQILSIGPAGENLVRFAAVMSGTNDACGRNGMGAVMGSKKLKAVAVRGHNPVRVADQEKLKKLAAEGAAHARDFIFLYELGTAGTVTPVNQAGGFPTRNYSRGVFEGAKKISGETLRDTLLTDRETCWACAVRCKRVVELSSDELGSYDVDPRYGGPEYETITYLGSFLEIDDLPAIAKASELCNKHGLDVISTGATIGFAMECFENGIITSEDVGDLDLSFGNVEPMLKLIEMIAHRQGIGDLLGEGSARAAERLGDGAEKYAMHVKGQELPGHMVQHKPTYSLLFAVNPFGADHESAGHDAFYSPQIPEDIRANLAAMGIYNTKPMEVLDEDKVRWLVYTQQVYAFLDSLELCVFVWGPIFQLYPLMAIPELVEAVTGWKTSLWELMKVGERRINLQRSFNAREGFTRANDRLPQRVFEEPLPDGPLAGRRVERDKWENARDLYYRMMNWDPETGNPTRAKLLEINLGWVVDKLDEAGVSLR